MNLLKDTFLTPLQSLRELIKNAGGIKAALYQLYRTEDLRKGCLVGTDIYGNKYYHNPRYFYLRNRWVDYVPHIALEYDASMIPPDWYSWLHHKIPIPPTEREIKKHYFCLPHQPNLSGTPGQYYPYSTTVPKISQWDPLNYPMKKPAPKK